MSDSSSDDEQGVKRLKSLADVQRLKIEKLMRNPERENFVFEKTETKPPKAFNPHEFVRNVMGASAGAGSGEFDIYRGCRRRELIRQEYIQQEAEKEKIKDEFEQKRLANILAAEEKTAKRRAKRLKQKLKLENKNKNKKDTKMESSDENSQQVEEEIDLSKKADDDNQNMETKN